MKKTLGALALVVAMTACGSDAELRQPTRNEIKTTPFVLQTRNGPVDCWAIGTYGATVCDFGD